MADSILKNILSQYNKKKLNAEYEAELRKQRLYKEYPKLQEIDNKLTSLAISTTKSMINNNDKSLLKDLNDNIIKLREEKNKIFTRFYKGINSASNNFGIGLSLAKEIITKDNGTIKVYSELDNGTTFKIRYYK